MTQTTDSSSWPTNPYVTWIVAIVLGVLSSLIATFLYPKLISVLEGRKIISRRKRQKEASSLNAIINTLHTSERERIEFYIRNYGLSLTLVGTGLVSALDATVILALDETAVTHMTRPTVYIIGLSAISTILFTLSNRLLNRIIFVRKSLADFNAYTISYEKEWGSTP